MTATNAMSQRQNPFESPPRAFISYARADGEAFATTLRERLECEQREITLWQDRIRMEGGVGWWKQITEALDQVEFLVMVMTPAAVASEIARKEWRYARQQGVRICPVIGVAGSELDFAVLPGWMRKAHFYDLDKEWDTFVSFLKSARKDSRVPFMAPDLHENFVARPEEFETLLCGLLDRSRMNPLAITTALQGSGGFGKTTLAVALCHNEDIISAFDDGILWATLGETPNIQHELTKLYAALTGERPAFVDADDAAIQLATRLEDKTCLIVIDDAWDPNHVKPFLRGGNQCCRLITTRRLPVVTEVGASRVFVNEMTQDQAVQMLTARLACAPADLGPLRELARRLGEWPLLLKLAASQLREQVERGDSLEGALVYVSRKLEKRGVVAFDRANATARNDAVARTVEASLELLNPVNRLRCIELSIFPEDKLIPLSAVGALWGMDEFDAGELIRELDNAALLDFDLKSGSIRIHDVLQSYLRSRLEDPGAVHARLVHQGWRDLYVLPDAYAWRWVGWHLAHAGEFEQLRILLLDFGWLQAKLAATSVQAVLEDFELQADAEDLGAVHDALRLGANGLTLDTGQLAAQLVARLVRGRWAAVDKLLDEAEGRAVRPWLTLNHASLTQPGGALLGILKGHAGSVEALALSPNGELVVTASGDWTLRAWELETGKTVRVLEGHEGAVHCVAITPDGRSVISGSEDRNLRVWDLNSGRSEKPMRGHLGAVRGVAVIPSGRLAASVSEDGTVRLWDLDRRTMGRTLPGGSHQLSAVAFMPDSKGFFFGAGDWNIRLHDVESGRLLRTFEGHSGLVKALAVGVDGRLLASASEDATVRVWDIASGELRMVLRGHLKEVDAVALTADGRGAVSGSRDYTVRLWDLATGTVRQTLEGHASFVRAVAIIAGGSEAISGSADRTIRHWNLHGTHTLQSATTHGDAVRFIAVSADGHKAVSGTRVGPLYVWNAESDCPARILDESEGGRDVVSGLKMSADGRSIVTASRDRTIRVWDAESGKSRFALTGHAHGVRRLEVSANGKRAVSLASGRTVRFWDVELGRPLRVLVAADEDQGAIARRRGSPLLEELEIGPVLDVAAFPISRDTELAISHEGTRAVLGAAGRVCVWNLESGATRHEELGEFDVMEIAIDAEARHAVIGSRFGTLRTWDLREGKTIDILEGHRGSIVDIVISADGRRAITAATDNTIRVWDLDAGRTVETLSGRFGNVGTVAIAPNGELAFWIYGDTIVVSSVARLAHLGSLSLDHQITAVAVAADGRRLALGDESGRVHFLCLES